MATGNRTLKLSILADVDELKKSLGTATTEVEGFGTKVGEFSKKAALAFAAAGAAVGAFAASAVKAAAEDETAQKKLEQTLKNSTNATAEQVAQVEKYITTQSIATATTDDELRPALARLVRTTKDVTEAQKLLTLAQNISLATGKPLLDVSNALAKAHDGNATALAKLGVQTKSMVTVQNDNTAAVDRAEKASLNYDIALKKYGATAAQTQKAALALSQAQDKIGESTTSTKTIVKDFDTLIGDLQTTFGGFIDNEAETAAFKFKQISIATQEAKESIGAALLPIVKELADFLITTVVPNINLFVDGLTMVKVEGKDAGSRAYEFGQQVRGIIGFLIAAKDELILIGQIIGFVFVASKIYTYITALMELVAAFKAIQAAAALAGVASAFATGGGSVIAATVALAGAGIAAGVANTVVNGTNTAQSMNATSATSAQLAAGAARAGTTVNNITVKAVDAEGASRAVAKVLSQSSARSIPALAGTSVRGN
jgi:hypothetical protein